MLLDWLTVFIDVWKRQNSQPVWVQLFTGATIANSLLHIEHWILNFLAVRSRLFLGHEVTYRVGVKFCLFLCDILQAILLIGLVWHEELGDAGMIYADLAVKALGLVLAAMPTMSQFWFRGKLRFKE